MGLKILHSADWHMDFPFAAYDPVQREYLKQERKKIPGKIAALCRRENCDMVLLSGDIFDNVTCRDSAEIVRDALQECGVPVFIAPGNHDYLTSGSPWLEMAWPENVYIFTVGMQSVPMPQLDCRVFGAGYRSMDCKPLMENFRAEGSERYKIAVLHGDPMRLRSPYCPVTTAQVRDSGLDYVALGHIHKCGSFRAKNSLCAWPGTPMGHGFDEPREKGVYIVELGKRCSSRFVALDTPRFYDLEVNTDHQDLEQLLPAVDRGDFYRITLTGSTGARLEVLKAKFSGLRHLEFVDNRELKPDPWERVGDDTLEGAYFRLLQSKLSGANEAQSEVIQLAADLSRAILDGKEVVL